MHAEVVQLYGSEPGSWVEMSIVWVRPVVALSLFHGGVSMKLLMVAEHMADSSCPLPWAIAAVLFLRLT